MFHVKHKSIFKLIKEIIPFLMLFEQTANKY